MSLLHSGDELSLRHLPDTSDASFSFQIPGLSTAENLLADDTDFFRGGADVSLETVASPRKVNDLLNLSSPMPRPSRKAGSSKKPSSASSSSGTKYEGTTIEELQAAKPTPSHTGNPRPSLLPGPSTAPKSLPGRKSARLAKGSVGTGVLGSLELPIAEESTPVSNQTKEASQPKKRVERRQKVSARSQTRVAERVVEKSRITTTDIPDTKFRADSPVLPAVTGPAIAATLLNDSTTKPDEATFSAADVSIQSVEALDTITERLVEFGQRLMNPLSQIPSDNHSGRSIATIPHTTNVNELPTIEDNASAPSMELIPESESANTNDDGPLTVSQLSPRKPSTIIPTPTLQVPASPSRSSSKRPGDDPPNSHPEKRIKLDATSAAQTASDTTHSQEPRPKTRSISRQGPKSGLSHSDTAAQARVATRVLRSAKSVSTTVQPAQSGSSLNHSSTERPKIARKGPVASTSTSNRGIKSQSSLLRHKPSSSLNQRKRPRLVSSTSKPAWVSTNNSQPPTNSTKHADSNDINSQSQSDPSRSLSGSSNSRSQRKYESIHPIPDFKALHAAHEASMANRKDNIHPTKPIEIQWETEIRAKERQRFDEMIKEKEREQERLKEQQRKEREEQEAREIRELRMKAIPKANEVPEWYKDVPRKKTKGGSLDASGASSIRR